MSGMKDLMTGYAMFAAMAMSGNGGFYGNEAFRQLTPEEKIKLKAIAESKRIDILKKRGVKEYFYGNNVIYARTQINADRKAKSKGYFIAHVIRRSELLCPICEANILVDGNCKECTNKLCKPM